MSEIFSIRDFIETKSLSPVFESVQFTNESGEQETKKELYITGPFLEGDVTNRNGRIYPVEMLEGAVSEFMKTKVRGIGVPGELNHPQSSIQIDLERVSHYVTELKMNGKAGIGKAKIASTPKGVIARNLINDGMILGVSTRGVGKLSEGDGDKTVSEFELITVDIVSDPSAPNAFVEAVLEGMQYSIGTNTDVQMINKLEGLIESLKSNLSVLPKNSVERSNKLFTNINNILDQL